MGPRFNLGHTSYLPFVEKQYTILEYMCQKLRRKDCHATPVNMSRTHGMASVVTRTLVVPLLCRKRVFHCMYACAGFPLFVKFLSYRARERERERRTERERKREI